ncbi:MAG: element excision factor XisI family protein [Pseudanabaenaceae cyanobacterium bins.39]|nr:element excision factor XisI family protein [Pseudanabaenaceae cyanobacterium bins.39]
MYDFLQEQANIIPYLEVREGKVWIQQDTTDFSVAEELLARGVIREDIVLGVKPAFVRAYTGFGVA